ncbi:MAG: hypothetical protein IPG68_00035 [Micrococcales bacterium]|nr:hypothetical protein [Micrococcales bacterium]
MDPSDLLVWSAGDAAQCDVWFLPARIPLEDGTARLGPVLMIACAHSRLTLRPHDPDAEDRGLLLRMWDPLQQLGRVPRRLLWDNDVGSGRRKRLPATVGVEGHPGQQTPCCYRRAT